MTRVKENESIKVRLVTKIDEWKAPHHNKLFQWVAGDMTRYLLGCYKCGEVATLYGNKENGHVVVVKESGLTISPSIGCPFCKAHYFIKDGKVIEA